MRTVLGCLHSFAAIGLLSIVMPASAQNILTVSPNPLAYTFQVGGSAPNPAPLVVFSTAGSANYTLSWSVEEGNWLSVSPTSGTTPSNASLVFINPAALTPKTYNGSITVTAPQHTAVTIPVTLTVQIAPAIAASPAIVAFSHQLSTPAPRSRNVTITSSGPPFEFTTSISAGTGGAWLTVSPATASTPGTVALTADPTGLAAGEYTSSLVITAPGTTNTPLTVPVTLRVSPNPTLEVTPRILAFNFRTGGSRPAPQTLLLRNGGGPLTFSATTSVASGANWLTAAPADSQTSAAVLVSVDPGTLAAGTYTGSVTITAPGAASPTEIIPVTLVVSADPLVNVSANELNFAFQTGGTAPAPQTIALTSTGNTANFTATPSTSSGTNWLTVSAASGTAPSDLTIGVNSANLAPGTYTGNVAIASAASAVPQNVAVTLHVSANPLLTVDKHRLAFTFAAGGNPPAAQTLAVSSTGAALAFTASATTNSGPSGWLVIGPLNGTTPSTLNVGVNPSGLLDGVYTGVIRISSTAVDNVPIYIPVSFEVSNASALTVGPGPLVFDMVEGSMPPAGKSLNVGSTGPALTFNASPSTLGNLNWLSVSPPSGVTPATLAVTVGGPNLARGQYTGSVIITSPNASNSPQALPVTLNVTAAANMAVSPASLDFAYQVGSAVPAPRTINVTSTSQVPLNVTATATSSGNWLSISPATANTPGTFSASINPAGLTAGSYSGTILFSSQAAGNTPQTVSVTLTVTAAPPIAVGAVVNAASNIAMPLSPGLLVSIYGTGLGPTTPVHLRLNNAGRVATSLGDVRILFDGIEAPLTYVSSTQINAVVPYEIGNRVTTRLEVEYQGRRSSSIEFRVADTAPGIFLLSGTQGAILNQNGTVNSSGNRAQRGSVAVIYATGEGHTNPAGVTGRVTDSVLPRPIAPYSVRIGGETAVVEYIGAAPGFVSGVLQVNVRIPQSIAAGSAVPVELTIGGVSTGSGVTMAVQ